MSEYRTLYDNGLPFSQKLADNIDALMYRVDNNKASAIVIDGDLGEGKTSLGVHVADYVNGAYGEGSFINLKQQLALGGDALRRRAVECYRKGLPVVVYDEAGDLSGRGSITAFNRKLIRFFEMYRALRILVIIVLPRFYTLDKKLLELGVIRFLLHCEKRTKRTGYFRGYDLQQMFYIKNASDKIIVKPKCYNFGVVNFYGAFLNFPSERARELARISTSNKIEEIEKELEYEEKKKELVTAKELTKILNRSYAWVVTKIRILGENPEIVEKKVKYYDKSIVERLQILIDEAKK